MYIIGQKIKSSQQSLGIPQILRSRILSRKLTLRSPQPTFGNRKNSSVFLYLVVRRGGELHWEGMKRQTCAPHRLKKMTFSRLDMPYCVIKEREWKGIWRRQWWQFRSSRFSIWKERRGEGLPGWMPRRSMAFTLRLYRLASWLRGAQGKINICNPTQRPRSQAGQKAWP